MADRFAAWLLTGPVGHLVAGVLDWLEFVARWSAASAWRAMRRRRRPGAA